MRTKILDYGSFSEQTRSHTVKTGSLEMNAIPFIPFLHENRRGAKLPLVHYVLQVGLKMKLLIVQYRLFLVSQQLKLKLTTRNGMLPMK